MSISALSSSSSGTIFSMNQGNVKRPEDFDSAEDFVSSVIGDNDSDGDGQLSVDEAGFLDKHFSEIDSDGDGYLSQEEMVADLQNRQEQMAMMGQMSMAMQGSDSFDMFDALMNELDADGDSAISQEESGLDDELFSTLDADGDGSISAEELQESMSTMTPPPAAEASSGSGSSSSSEEADEEYDEFDYNKDGVVSFEELQQAFAGGEGSLEDIVGQRGDAPESGQGEGQSVLQRMAMRAYENQNSVAYNSSSLGALA